MERHDDEDSDREAPSEIRPRRTRPEAGAALGWTATRTRRRRRSGAARSRLPSGSTRDSPGAVGSRAASAHACNHLSLLLRHRPRSISRRRCRDARRRALCPERRSSLDSPWVVARTNRAPASNPRRLVVPLWYRPLRPMRPARPRPGTIWSGGRPRTHLHEIQLGWGPKGREFKSSRRAPELTQCSFAARHETRPGRASSSEGYARRGCGLGVVRSGRAGRAGRGSHGWRSRDRRRDPVGEQEREGELIGRMPTIRAPVRMLEPVL